MTFDLLSKKCYSHFMKRNREEPTELLKKVKENPDSLSFKDKMKLRKLAKNPEALVSALMSLGNVFGADDFGCCRPNTNEGMSDERIIAENYIALAKFAIEKDKIENATGLKAEIRDGGIVLYALTPSPVELDIEQYATSDYPTNKEILLEAEALSADLFSEDGTEKFLDEIIQYINAAEI